MILTTVPKGKNWITENLRPNVTRAAQLKLSILLYTRDEPADEDEIIASIKDIWKGKFTEGEIEEAIDKAIREGYAEEW